MESYGGGRGRIVRRGYATADGRRALAGCRHAHDRPTKYVVAPRHACLERPFYTRLMSARASQRATNVAYSARNRATEIARVQRRQAATLAFLREVRMRPCVDCRQVLQPHQMDFDHREPRLKAFRLTSGRAMLKSRAALLDEARKCDVVCANCHRIRTSVQRRGLDRSSGGASRYLERKRQQWRGQAELLNERRDVPCADCGHRYPPYVMDFDHRDPSAKRATVTRMIGRASTARILDEVAKCDIVCANCHRARTYRRRMTATRAGVAQLEERDPSKVDVAGSNPVSRSTSS
jgi:formate-dependent nitrite reductase cytochrome c552 subunit